MSNRSHEGLGESGGGGVGGGEVGEIADNTDFAMMEKSTSREMWADGMREYGWGGTSGVDRALVVRAGGP